MGNSNGLPPNCNLNDVELFSEEEFVSVVDELTADNVILPSHVYAIFGLGNGGLNSRIREAR